jgi:hypothetical protein
MKKKLFEGLGVAPGKNYVAPFMIALVAAYLVLLTVVTIAGLVVLWPSCNYPKLTPSAINDLTVTSVSPGFGDTKDEALVSIRGTGFADKVSVNFNNKPSSDVKVVDSTHLRARIPQVDKKGIVDIVVNNNPNENPAGKSRVLARGFLYVDDNDSSPKPSINSITPVSGPLTGGQRVTIKGSGFQNTTMVSFGGLPGINIQALNDATLVVTSPPHGEGKVDVAVSASDVALAPEGYTYTCWTTVPIYLFIMIILASALGSCLHGLRSLVWHVSERNLQNRALPKYFLLPFIGAAIGVIFFLAVSAGFYKVEGSTESMILIGLCTLVGMFSDEAAVKLKKIAESLLTEVPPVGKDSLISVTSITPKCGRPNENTEVTILGTGFDEPPIVRFGNEPAFVKSYNKTSILVTTPKLHVGEFDVSVINKNGQSFTVRNGYEYVAPEDLKKPMKD